MPKIAKEIVESVKARTPAKEKSLVNDIAALFEGPLKQYTLTTNRLMMHSAATLNANDINTLREGLLLAIKHAKNEDETALVGVIKSLSKQRLIHHKASYGTISDANAADSTLSDENCLLIARELIKTATLYALTSSDSQNSTPSPSRPATRESSAWVGSKSNTPVSQSKGPTQDNSPVTSNDEADEESTEIKPAKSNEEDVFKTIYANIGKKGMVKAQMVFQDTLAEFVAAFPNKTFQAQERYANYAVMAFIIENTGNVPTNYLDRFKANPPLAEFNNIDFEPLQNAIRHYNTIQSVTSRPTVAAAREQKIVSTILQQVNTPAVTQSTPTATNTKPTRRINSANNAQRSDRQQQRADRKNKRTATRLQKQSTEDSTATASSQPSPVSSQNTAIDTAMARFANVSEAFDNHVATETEYAEAAHAADEAARILTRLHELYTADNNSYSASWAILNAKIWNAKKEYANYLTQLSHIVGLQTNIQDIDALPPEEKAKAIDRNRFLNGQITDLLSNAETIIQNANLALETAKSELLSQKNTLPTKSSNGTRSYEDYLHAITNMQNDIRTHDINRAVNIQERIAQLEKLFSGKNAGTGTTAPEKPKPGKLKIPAGLEATIAKTHTATKKFYDIDSIIKEINDISAKLTVIENNTTAKKLELQTELDTIIALRKGFTDNITRFRSIGPLGVLDEAINEALRSPIPVDDAKRAARDDKIALLGKTKDEYNEQDNRIKALQGKISLMPDPVTEEKKVEDEKAVVSSPAADEKKTEAKKTRPGDVAFFGDIYIIGKSGLMQREYDKIATPSELPLPADEKKDDDDEVLLKLESSVETKEHREKSKDAVLAFKAGKTLRTSPWFDETEFRMTILKFQDVDNLDGRFPFGSDPRAIFTEHTQTNPKTKSQYVVSTLRQLPDNLNPKRIDAHKVFMDFIEADHTKKQTDAHKKMSASAYATYTAELNTEKSALDDAFKEYMKTLAGKAPTFDEVHKLLIDTYKKKIVPDQVKDMKDEESANQAVENAFGLRETASKLVANYQAIQKSRQKITAGTPRSFKAWLFNHVKQPQSDMAKTILAQVLSMRARSGSSVIFISDASSKGQVEAIMLVCAALNQLGIQINCVDQRRGIEVKDRVLLYEIPQDQAQKYAEFMKKNFNDILERLEPEKPEHAADAKADASATATSSASSSASSNASSSAPASSSSSASSSAPVPDPSSVTVDPTATADSTKSSESKEDETVLAETVLAKTKLKTPDSTPLPLSASAASSADNPMDRKYEDGNDNNTDSSDEIISPEGVDVVITRRNGFGSSH